MPSFNGARAILGGWSADGSLRYIAYTPMPTPANGALGINWQDGQNLSPSGLGLYADQVWIGNSQLRQVAGKTEVADGAFWVDRSSSRLYLTSSDASKSGIEVSDKTVAMNIHAPGMILEGLQIIRFSPNAQQGAVITFFPTADNNIMRNVEISDAAFVSVQYSGNGNLLENNMMKNVTVAGSNWMGVGALYTNDLTIEDSKLSGMNRYSEFTSSPQSGGAQDKPYLAYKSYWQRSQQQ